MIVTRKGRIPIHGISQVPLLHRLPMTKVRMFVARVLYRILHLGLRNRRQIVRRGIRYEVNLSEGIELALFVFGRYQKWITDTKYYSVPPDAVILDVGANVGSMTLEFARLVPQGRVYSFEPTDYAYTKLVRNCNLNPELKRRIVTNQLFVSDQTTQNHRITAYSSWKVDRIASDSHRLHGGSARPAQGVAALALDDFCRKEGVDKVHLIKIDTDERELPVMQGAQQTVERHRPYLIFEVGLCVMEELGFNFKQYIDYFSPFGYLLINLKNGRKVTLENYLREIPLRSTTDLLAIPNS